jgi:flavorubredoxin
MMKPEDNPLPREIAPGIFWLGICHEQHHFGKVYHTYNAAYLLIGSESSMLIETGHSADYPVISRQVRDILAEKKSTLKYLFLSHQETPHAGGIGRLLRDYPEITVCCDVSDYHLSYPEYAHRMWDMEVGDAIDLGDRQLIAVEPVVRDLRTSLWGFDTGARALFPGDGFAYSHYHWDGHCGKIAEEATSLDLAEVLGVFAERALFWTRFADMNIYADRLEELLEEYDVAVVGPSHGLPVLDVAVTMPKVRAGLVSGY